jgi:hypothetical protein
VQFRDAASDESSIYLGGMIHEGYLSLLKYRVSDHTRLLSLGYLLSALPPFDYISVMTSKATTPSSDVLLLYIKSTDVLAPKGFHYL